MSHSIFREINYKYILLLLITGIAIYSPSLFISFFSDEPAFVNRNEVTSLNEWVHLLDKKDYDGAYYRPVGNLLSGTLTFFFGGTEWLYRLFNLLLHTINGILVYFLAWSVFHKTKSPKEKSLLAAILFIIFPLSDYAVIWHTDLFDRILFFFYIGALLFYLDEKKWLALVFALLAFLSKEMSFSLPAAVFICGYFLKQKTINKSVADTLPFIVLLILVMGFRYIVLNNHLFESDLTHPHGTIFLIVKNLIFFFGLLTLPFDSYRIEDLVSGYLPAFIVFGAMCFALITFVFTKHKNTRYILLFTLTFIIITILPASRLLMKWYLYLPTSGFVILLSYLLFLVTYKYRKVIITLIVLAYTVSLVNIQFNWIKYTSISDKTFSQLKEIVVTNSNEPVYFLTIPAKINNYPVNHLNFEELLRYKTGISNKIEVLSRASLSGFDSEISAIKQKNGYTLKLNYPDSFIPYGYEDMIDKSNPEYANGKIISLKLNMNNFGKQIYNYSNGKYYKVQ